MCVKNQNLSVAKMCLGNMKNLRATHALRKAELAEMEVAAQTAMLAIALGMRVSFHTVNYPITKVLYLWKIEK